MNPAYVFHPAWLSCFLHEGALEKSARAAGLPANTAEKYAADVVKVIPGNLGIIR